VEMELNASPVAGLEGYMNIDSLIASGMQLDTIRAQVHTQGDTKVAGTTDSGPAFPSSPESLHLYGRGRGKGRGY
jgi:hypothetical protein